MVVKEGIIAQKGAAMATTLALSDENLRRASMSSTNSSSSESISSMRPAQIIKRPVEATTSLPIAAAMQAQVRSGPLDGADGGRQVALDQRELSLRRKQQALQEQYARLQAMHSGASPRPPSELLPPKDGEGGSTRGTNGRAD